MFQCPPISEPVVWISPCEPDQVVCALPDLDQDGTVGVLDFLALLSLWGEATCDNREPPLAHQWGDINQDGEVGIQDFLILMLSWTDGYNSATWNRCDC